MVLDYYKLAEQPFGVTPDPRFLYLGATHREALASALYGVTAGRGFTALIARPGMGKTTLLFDFLRKVHSSAKTVFLFQSQRSPQDLIRSILADLGIDEDGLDLVRMQKKLNETLVRESSEGRRLVVVIDEAQNLDDAALEVVRMLSNFETSREKLMHIMLAGQPQLAEKLSSVQLVQLRQRISMVARLQPFDEEETRLYIEHRLRVAGYDFSRPLFTKQAVAMIAKQSEGIPRNINNICFNAMSLGCVSKKETIDVPVIREVLDDLNLESLFPPAVAKSQPVKPVSVRPQFSSNAGARPSLTGWPLKLGIPLAVALVAGLFFFRSTPNRIASQPVSSSRSDAQQSSVSAPASAPVPTALPVVSMEATIPLPALSQGQPEQPTAVTVAPHETISKISMGRLGKYDQEVLEKIRALNPWLSDPNHIEPGQTIVVPSSEATSPTIHPASEPIPGARTAEPEKP